VTYVAPVLGLLADVVGTADVFLALDPFSLSLRKAYSLRRTVCS
jgi:hypothetical protein